MNKLFTTIILITSLLAAVCLGASSIHSNTAGDIIKNNITSLLEDTTLTDSEDTENSLLKNLVHSLTGDTAKVVGDQLTEVKEISITFTDLAKIIIHSSGITVILGIIFLLLTAVINLIAFFVSGEHSSV